MEETGWPRGETEVAVSAERGFRMAGLWPRSICTRLMTAGDTAAATVQSDTREVTVIPAGTFGCAERKLLGKANVK